MYIYNGIFFTPFYIFIKGNRLVDQNNILDKLGLNEYELIASEEERMHKKDKNGRLYVYQRNGWIHLMDDWLYSLWNNKNARINIDKLGHEVELFYFAMEDEDEYFEFGYYKEGKLVRKYRVDNISLKGKVITTNYGHPLESEESSLKLPDFSDKIIPIAKSLGIHFNYVINYIKCFKLNEASNLR